MNQQGSATPYLIVQPDGKVGIGVANPSEALDVSGNMQFSGALMPGGNAGTAGFVLMSQGAGNSPVWVDTALLGDKWGGQVAQTQGPLVGDGTSANPIGLQSGTNAGDVLIWNGSQWTIKPSPFDSVCNSAIANYVMKWTGSELCNSIIYDNGTRVGIGTAAPYNILVVKKDTNFTSGVYIENKSPGANAATILALKGDTGQGSIVLTSSNYSGVDTSWRNSVIIAAERTSHNLILSASNSTFGRGRIYMYARQRNTSRPTVTVDSGVVCINCKPGSNNTGLLVVADTFVNNPNVWGGYYGVAVYRSMPVDGKQDNVAIQLVNMSRSDSGAYRYSLYLADPDGGHGVIPDAFEIWEYPDSIGTGTCCRQRFRIMPSRGLNNPPPVTIDPHGDVSIGVPLINAPYRLTIQGGIGHRLYSAGPNTGVPIPYGQMYVVESDEYPNYHEEFIITFGNAGDNNSSIFIGPNSNTGGVGRVDINAAIIVMRGGGKVGINVSVPTNILTVQQGSPTDPIADSWTVYSTRETKAEVLGVVGLDDLSKYLKYFREMPVYKWRRTEGEQVRLSPMADDSNVPGEIRAYDGEGNVQGIDLYGYIGFLHVVMKGMYETIEQQNSVIAQQQEIIKQLEERVSILEKQAGVK